MNTTTTNIVVCDLLSSSYPSCTYTYLDQPQGYDHLRSRLLPSLSLPFTRRSGVEIPFWHSFSHTLYYTSFLFSASLLRRQCSLPAPLCWPQNCRRCSGLSITLALSLFFITTQKPSTGTDGTAAPWLSFIFTHAIVDELLLQVGWF